MQGLVAQNITNRPKVVVGIVVDQMRWDYLYRFYNRFDPNGGFKRLLAQGFSCENTTIPYALAVTACGHASIYTGSVPAINGITGNGWYDYEVNNNIYVTDDDSVTTIGSVSKYGKMSPKRLLVTSICDELKLATNFQSKVIGIALKDRSSILPAGHSADAAYWFDPSNGNWISSSYYMKELPTWVTNFNEKKLADHYYNEGWKTLYPVETYTQSDPINSGANKEPFGPGNKFPYQLGFFIGKNYNVIEATPHGNTITLEMAKAAITNESFGKDSITDFLAISLSSPDYIGHTFGPNSIETEDDYLRLDKDLGLFLDFLDKQIGRKEYLLFITADHGVAQVPSFLQHHKIPAGNYDTEKMTVELNILLKEKYKLNDLVIGVSNNQVYIDRQALGKSKVNRRELHQSIVDYLEMQPGISRAFSLTELGDVALNSHIKEQVVNGYYPLRSGDIQLIPKPQYIEGFEGSGTTHGSWNPYDSHIPLIWFGSNVKPGKTSSPVNMTDIAPTISSYLHIQAPSGNIGSPIKEIVE
jgi:predicted AlkP superfamily pyrophosphatase or phosphodiesterase